eukprot:TRINITY_DN2250_c0_g3_i1.p1 TRINITY_DN2250_c0_g3~~TRINITY_DN2250_c0_g3_i1.p1  ORF type:complete len:443 (-),score=80.12 TRINITY_DN2250_c0_g3_i1:62-1225(-)
MERFAKASHSPHDATLISTLMDFLYYTSMSETPTLDDLRVGMDRIGSKEWRDMGEKWLACYSHILIAYDLEKAISEVQDLIETVKGFVVGHNSYLRMIFPVFRSQRKLLENAVSLGFPDSLPVKIDEFVKSLRRFRGNITSLASHETGEKGHLQEAYTRAIVEEFSILFASKNRVNQINDFANTIQEHLIFKSGAVYCAYLYWSGKFDVFNGKYREAESKLKTCLELCPFRQVDERRQVYKYYAPVRASLGHVVRQGVLRKFGLFEMEEIFECIRGGQLGQLSELMSRHEDMLLRDGMYFLFEKIRAVVAYRQASLMVFNASNRSIRVAVSVFQKAFEFLGEKMEMEEVECVLLNLIVSGRIRGYIAQSRGIFVFAKEDPFPDVANS